MTAAAFTVVDSALPSRHQHHRGHRVHPEFDAIVADHLARVLPLVEQLRARGWSQIVVDPVVDCEVPETPECLDLVATLPADDTPGGTGDDTPGGAAGSGPARRLAVRFVLEGEATLSHAYGLLGSPALTARAEYVAHQYGDAPTGALLVAASFDTEATAVPRLGRCTYTALAVARP